MLVCYTASSTAIGARLRAASGCASAGIINATASTSASSPAASSRHDDALQLQHPRRPQRGGERLHPRRRQRRQPRRRRRRRHRRAASRKRGHAAATTRNRHHRHPPPPAPRRRRATAPAAVGDAYATPFLRQLAGRTWVERVATPERPGRLESVDERLRSCQDTPRTMCPRTRTPGWTRTSSPRPSRASPRPLSDRGARRAGPPATCR